MSLYLHIPTNKISEIDDTKLYVDSLIDRVTLNDYLELGESLDNLYPNVRNIVKEILDKQ